MASCPACGASYRLATDPDGESVRSLCPCESNLTCARCKRGDRQRPNQAFLDLDGEVRRYACAAHGSSEAADFPVPEASAQARRAALPAEPFGDPTWAATKAQITANMRPMRDPVVCLACAHPHRYNQRGLVFDDARHTGLTVCPECRAPDYQCKD